MVGLRPRVSPGSLQRAERWPIVVLAGLTALVFRHALFGGQVLCERDIGIWWYGRIEALVRAAASGAWPVWDPHTAFGQPLLASPGAQVFYPWTWISLVVSPGLFVTLYTAGHFFFSGVGLWVLARRLGVSTAGALVASALWVSSGPFLSLVNVWLHFAGAAWIPWILLAADWAFRSPGAVSALTLGAALSGQILSGSVDIVAMTGVLAAVYALACFDWKSPLNPGNRRLLGWGLLAVAAAACLTAAQWLPAVELLRASGRTALAEGVRTHWSLHPASLAQGLLPVLPQALPLLAWVKQLLFDGEEPLIGSIYLGLAALPLVAGSLTRGSQRLTAGLLGLALASILCALGRHSVVYPALVAILPPLGVLRYPSKAIILLPFAWALLAGLGFDAWRDRALSWGRRERWTVLAPTLIATAFATAALLLVQFRAESVAALLLEPGRRFAGVLAPTAARLAWATLLALAVLLLAVLRAARPRTSGATAAGVAGLAILDLFLAHQSLNPTVDRERFESPPLTLAHLAKDRPTRIYAFDYGPRLRGQTYRRPAMEDPFEVVRGGASDPRVDKALGLQSYLYYAAATRWGLSSGYGADLQGTAPRHVNNLSLVLWASQETPEFLRMLRLASVSSVIALHTEGLEELVPRAVLPGPFVRPIRVFSVPDPLPRTYAVGGVRIADGLAAYKTLVDPGFDPTREIVLPAGSPAAASPSFSGTSRLGAYLPDRVRIEADLAQPGYVVLVDAYDPAWRATVDGSEAPVLRANTAFRAVAVPAGHHEVELRYRPRSVVFGLAVSAGTLLLGLLFIGSRLRAARRS